MARVLRIAGRILLVLIFVAAMAFGAAWLLADRWTGELATPAPVDAELPEVGWSHYGNDPGGSRYSPAAQVDRETIGRLAPVWIFRTGETGDGFQSGHKHTFQATPILVGSTLYFSTAFNRVFAVDALTGRERWHFDAAIDPEDDYTEVSNRGVAFWRDATAAPGARCRERIFAGTLDARLIAVDAATGLPCRDFADDGAADLRAALRITDRGEAYPVTSPPIVIGDTVVLGSGMIDNWKADLGLGTVWAYDARSGALRWKWHAIPRAPDAAAADNLADWIPEQAAHTGTANVWSPLSADPDRGLVFAATGSASPDYYGGERLGTNRHANSLVALDAATGQVRWSYQVVRHDLWDYDLPAQPVLAEIERGGVYVPAVILPTKMGLLFSFHRDTGEPFFPIEERLVPASDIPGEQAWPSQPFPVLPPPLVPHRAMTAGDAWGLTPIDRGECRDLLASLRSEGIYTPPSLQGTVMIPGNAGGSNWGGIAWHPGRQVAIANTIHLPFAVALIPRADFEHVARSGRFPRAEFSPQLGTPFGMRRESLFSSWGLPCVAPPWGTLAAVDMAAGEILWQVPLGTTRDVTGLPFGIEYGMPGLGGPLVTAGGLVFIGAAMDDYLRAFDLDSGEEVWRARLPAGGQATPMTYQLGGRQYVVVAAGGHARMGTRRGDYLVAFALAE